MSKVSKSFKSYYSCCSQATEFQGEKVHNVTRILLVGSKKPLLQAVALKVFSLCVWLEPEWIHRALNERADYLSRIIDYDVSVFRHCGSMGPTQC